MDLKALLELIAGHYVVLTGTTLALFFTTCMILLIRSIGNKSEEAGSSGVVATIDVKEIEGAMKRVLASQPVSVMSSSAGVASAPGAIRDVSETGAVASGGDPEAMGALQGQIAERDQRIDELTKQLEASRLQPGGDSADDSKSEEAEAMKTKLDELQGRLAEYEIIEDDIADLSLFKEENIRLKDENAKLKDDLAKAATAAPPPPAPEPEAAPKEPEPVLKFEKVDKFELDPNDDVMKEFAAAVSVQSPPSAPALAQTAKPAADPQAEIDALLAGVATQSKPEPDSAQAAIDAMLSGVSGVVSESAESPLDETTDADKLLTEAQSIGQAPDAPAADPLNDSLDTDKLMAEVESLKTAKADDTDDAFAHFNKAAQG